MATKVVIEGSRITPSDKLAPGERRAALLTKSVQNLIDRGFVILVSSEELPDETAPVEDQTGPEGDAPGTAPAPEPPNRNASADDWSEFLTLAGIEHEPGASRTALIELWDNRDDG